MNALHTENFKNHIAYKYPDLTLNDIKQPVSYYTFRTWTDIVGSDVFYSDGYATYYGFISYEDEMFFVYTIPERTVDFDRIVEDNRIQMKILNYGITKELV